MNRHARIFFFSLCLLGAFSFAANVFPFESANPIRYGVFLVAAMGAAAIRLSEAALSGAVTLNFIFVLIGIIALSPSETMLLACLVTLVQYGWRPVTPVTRHQVVLQVASVALAVGAASQVYQIWRFPDLSIDQPLRLLLATSVYFVLNSFPVAVARRLTTGTTLAQAWRECHTWTLPYYLFGAIAAGSFSFLKQAVGWGLLLFLLPFIYLMYRHYRLHASRKESENRHHEEIQNLHLRTIEALALAIEAKGQNTHHHLVRVQTFAVALGEALGLVESEMHALRAASMLHDIGELAVPDHITSKPGRLLPEEFEKMKIHTLVGAEILERVHFPYPVVPAVRHHHERWNGTGYPDGLRGEQIPVAARILGVVDAYVAMTTGNEYFSAIKPEQAVAALAKEAGQAYDPRVLAALAANYEEWTRLAEQRAGALKGRQIPDVRPLETSPAVSVEEPRPASFLVSIAAARQEAQALFELAQELGNSLSLDETLSVFAVRLRKTVPFDTIAIYVRREGTLRPEYVSGENVRLLSALSMQVGQGLSGTVAQSRKPVVNGDPRTEYGYREEPGRSTPLRAALAIPLEGIGGVIGVLTLYNSEKDSFARDHLRILQVIGTKVALSIENALKYLQAESSASTDYLTGLFNARSLFLHLESELARCRRLETPLAILVSDLDGFKQVNDRFGHLEGNKLLQRVAQRLREACREYDCVARMGGDEFVLVLPGLTADAVKAMVPRLRETVRAAGKDVLNEDVIGFSVGEAYFPVDGTNAEQLLAEADKRMYQVKARTKLLKAAQSGFDFDSAKAGV